MIVNKPIPNHTFIKQTKEKYTLYENFIQSEYYIKRLGYDLGRQTKQLLDTLHNPEFKEFIELNKLNDIQEYISQDKDRFFSMIAFAVNTDDVDDLPIGQHPSKEQLKNLKQDVVWLEKQKVGNKDLYIPMVYLSNQNQAEENKKINTTSQIDAQINDALNTQSEIVNDYIDEEDIQAQNKVEKEAKKSKSLIISDGFSNLSVVDDKNNTYAIKGFKDVVITETTKPKAKLKIKEEIKQIIAPKVITKPKPKKAKIIKKPKKVKRQIVKSKPKAKIKKEVKQIISPKKVRKPVLKPKPKAKKKEVKQKQIIPIQTYTPVVPKKYTKPKVRINLNKQESIFDFMSPTKSKKVTHKNRVKQNKSKRTEKINLNKEESVLDMIF